jgi:ketosteroid isomerase-like protein
VPREFHFSRDLVFALGQYEFAIKESGGRAAADWVHVFKVENGKLTASTEYTDAAQFVLAWR